MIISCFRAQFLVLLRKKWVSMSVFVVPKWDETMKCILSRTVAVLKKTIRLTSRHVFRSEKQPFLMKQTVFDETKTSNYK